MSAPATAIAPATDDAVSSPPVLLAVTALHPNDYNPNEMTEAAFEELVVEVEHLGRLPKPLIVRPDGDGYVIVDGEHGWRAARQLGWAEVPCEMLDVDTFEAMRQTYKRNQHGAHNPVLLGRMFRRMMEDRGLSQRSLAQEIAVSEGTVRNALSYAAAADLRNSYAFDRLSVRQIRAYLDLPDHLRDFWLDAGADLKAATDALRVPVEGHWIDAGDGTRHVMAAPEPEVFTAMLDAGLVAPFAGSTASEFVAWAHRVARLWAWREWMRPMADLDAYIGPVGRLGLDASLLDRHLPCHVDAIGSFAVLLPADDWAQILSNCATRTTDDALRDQMIAASIRHARTQAGQDDVDVTNPLVLEVLDVINAAPDFIRTADLPREDKFDLASYSGPGVPEDVWLEALRATCALRERRWRILTGGDEAVAALSAERQEDVKAALLNKSVQSTLEATLRTVQTDRQIARRETLFTDRAALMEAMMVQLEVTDRRWRDEVVGGKPALEVLAERCAALPWPEFLLLAGLVVDPQCIVAYWLRAAGELSRGASRPDVSAAEMA